MNITDSFISEVSDAVRRDRLFVLYRRYGWIVIVLIVAIISGSGYYQWSKAQRLAMTKARGDKIITALNQPQLTDKMQILNNLLAQNYPKELIDLHRANIVTNNSDINAAVDILDAMATSDNIAPLYRDLALLKLATLPGNAITIDRRRQILSSLSKPNAPFRAIALEQMALIELASGEVDNALKSFIFLLEEPDLSQALKQRIARMIFILGGTLNDELAALLR